MSWLSSIFGGGSSNSSSSTVNKTTLNTTTTTIFETDELAKAMQSQADATQSQADAALKSSEIELIKEKAKLNQNALFFNEVEGGLKKWSFLAIFAYGGYRIIKKGKLL